MSRKTIVTQLNDHIWLMDDNHEATGYLVTGKEKALVIDTMNGSDDLHEIVREITELPIMVVNTHGHPDHIFGNVYFDCAYLHPDDFELAASFAARGAKAMGLKIPPFLPIRGGEIIDLGDLTLEVIELPGHTPGGICLLLKEDRILFTGDSINHHLWMQLDGCLRLDEFLQKLDQIEYVKEKADRILHGHAQGFDDISLFDEMRQGIRDLATQKNREVTKNDPPYHWFGGVGKQHPFDDYGSVICYREESLPPEAL